MSAFNDYLNLYPGTEQAALAVLNRLLEEVRELQKAGSLESTIIFVHGLVPQDLVFVDGWPYEGEVPVSTMLRARRPSNPTRQLF